MDIEAPGMAPPQSVAVPTRIYRHRLPVRIMHWVNVVCLTVLLMSGLNIFNASPQLYWGHDSSGKPWVSFHGANTPQGPLGITKIGSAEFVTTGVLGVSKVDGQYAQRAFPGWATIPTTQWLAVARHYHLFFAWIFVVNGLLYIGWTIFTRHLKRDLLPTRQELRNIGTSIWDHLRFKHPTGAAATRYNVLQSLAYLIVIFGLLPLVVLCGMALSPRIDTVFTGWVEFVGGRQSARTLHFLAAFGLLLFVIVHVVEVIIAGVWNEMRSMITGWYKVPQPHPEKKESA